jgi:cytochrome d ubiquinol oxidase subunit I
MILLSVDWSLALFVMMALLHWVFVPLTLGLAPVIAITKSISFSTGDDGWEKLTRFWMRIFLVNFVASLTTGLVLKLEYTDVWSDYSWFTGSFFTFSMTLEGILAFLLQGGMVTLMFYGLKRYRKGVNLIIAWGVAIVVNVSVVWQLATNAWMQNPTGFTFNPQTARLEVDSISTILFNPTTVNKILHTVTSSYLLSGIVILGIGSWFLLKGREITFAKRSILVGSTFGFLMGIMMVFTGDGSSREVARTQPMKFAAMQGLYEGQQNAPLIAIGLFERPQTPDDLNPAEFRLKIEIPNMLSYLAFLDPRAFVPGIRDLVRGNENQGIPSYFERMERGRVAIEAITGYKDAVKHFDNELAAELRSNFKDEYWMERHFNNLGYGYFEDPRDLIPNIPVTFYAFHLMILLGIHFMIMLGLSIGFMYVRKLIKRRWFLRLSILTVPFVYVAFIAGWTLSELGRQPWVIQDLMPKYAALSEIQPASMEFQFWFFAILFATLSAAVLYIFIKQIKLGPGNDDYIFYR